MTKVSNFPLRKDIWERVFDLFISTLADMKDRRKIRSFVEDFFSPTEKVMFAKRLTLAVMLANKQDYQNISKILKVSPPTIAKMSLKIKYDGKGLHPIINGIFKKQAVQVLWQEILDLFDLPIKGSLKSPDRFRRKIKREKEIRKIKMEF